MPKIFISYKRQDRDTVYPIVDEIKQNTDIDCWIVVRPSNASTYLYILKSATTRMI